MLSVPNTEIPNTASSPSQSGKYKDKIKSFASLTSSHSSVNSIGTSN